MRKYIENLHTKPTHHKKQVALLTSATLTLLIFGIWALTNFGSGGVIAKNSQEEMLERQAKEVGPLESLRSSIAASFAALKDAFREDETVDSYGR